MDHNALIHIPLLQYSSLVMRAVTMYEIKEENCGHGPGKNSFLFKEVAMPFHQLSKIQ